MKLVHNAALRGGWLVLLVGSVLAGCKPEATSTAKAATLKPEVSVRVTTATAQVRPMPRYTTLTATVVADRESDVAADVSGKILSAPVERGMSVKSGATLLVLDRRSANISTREAAANVALARTQAELARADCARAEELFKSGAIGESEYSRSRAQCGTTLASMEAASARQDAALQALGDAVIRAPFAGIVSERFVNVGEYVRPESRVVHLVSSDPLRLRIPVPEALVGQVTQGMQVELRVSAYPDVWFAGTVQYLGAALRESTRDLVVEAVVPNPELKLRPGMFAVARLLLPAQPTTVVPRASVRSDGSLSRVFVVRDGVLEERIVEVGATQDDLVEVRKGVKPGETVVSPVPSEARDGARVAS